MTKYEEIVQNIKTQILNGTWKSGEKVPSLRQLTRKYKVSNNTILLALRLLKDEGYLFSVSAVGYFVSTKNLHQIDVPSKIILKSYYDVEVKNLELVNFVNIELLDKFLTDSLITFLFNLYKTQQNYPQISYLSGSPSLISTLSDFFEEDNIFIQPENIIIGSSFQLATEMIIRIFLEKKKLTTVTLSNPSHYSVINIFEKWVNIKTINLLSDGWDLNEFENLLSNEKIELVYLTANFHDPTGICWSDEKKIHLLKLAEKYDFYIIEEDSYFPLYYKKSYSSLKSLERIGKERIFYIRDFSMLFGSVVGITCIVVPPKFREKFLIEKAAFAVMPSKIQQKILENIINTGYLKLFLKKFRKILFYRAKYLTYLLKDIPELKIIYPLKGGCSIWIQLSKKIDEDKFYSLCKENNLLILPGYIFYQDKKYNSKFRISFASTTLYEIKLGVMRIKNIISRLHKSS